MRRVLVPAAAVLALALAACSSTQSAPTADPADAVATVVGNDRLEFDPDEIEAPEGDFVLALQCRGNLPHDIVVASPEGEDTVVASCRGNQLVAGEVSLPAGMYTFYCSIPGHRGAGMEGVLHVG